MSSVQLLCNNNCMNLLLISPSADGYIRVSRYGGAKLLGCVDMLFEEWVSAETLLDFLDSYRQSGETETL